MTAGIAGFVNGLFQGMDWREARDDKARKRKIDDEVMGWERKRFDWEKGDQAYLEETRADERVDRAYTMSERQRALELRDQEQAVLNDWVDEIKGEGNYAAPAPSADAPPQPQPPDDVQVPSAAIPFAVPGRAGSGRSLGYGILGDVVTGGAGQANVAGDPGVDRLPAAPAGNPQGFSILQSDPKTGQPMAMAPPRADAPQGQVIPVPTKPDPSQPNPAHSFGQPAGLLPDAGELAVRGASALNAVPMSILGGAANAVNRAINPVVKYATGKEFPLVNGAPGGPAAPSPAAQPATAERGRPAPAVQAAVPGTPAPQAKTDRQSLAFPAPTTSEGTPMASLSMGRELGLIGKDGVVKSTPGQRERAATGFVAAYQREKIPAVVEHYMRTGQLDKAKAFEEWTQDKEVKAGMKAWAKAGHAFSVGDGEGFLDSLAEAYNVRGYADDGYSVDRSKSRLVYADNGDLLGAQITFIDDGTGKEFVQNFEGINDLMAVGWGMLAPEKQFELGWSATYGAKKPDPFKIDPAKLMSAVEERKSMDPEFAKLPRGEQEGIMMEAFRRVATGAQGSAQSGDVPVDPLD